MQLLGVRVLELGSRASSLNLKTPSLAVQDLRLSRFWLLAFRDSRLSTLVGSGARRQTENPQPPTKARQGSKVELSTF